MAIMEQGAEHLKKVPYQYQAFPAHVYRKVPESKQFPNGIETKSVANPDALDELDPNFNTDRGTWFPTPECKVVIPPRTVAEVEADAKAELEETVAAMDKTISGLRDSLATARKQNQDLTSANKDLSSQNADLTKQVAELTKQIKKQNSPGA